MSERKQHIDTKLIHAGEPIPRIEGAVMMPIFQSSTFESPGGDSYDTMKYIRLNNTPNHQALHDKLSALENAESALVTASGMAAISTALFTLLKPGGHLLAQDVLYGGTLGLLDTQFEALGLSYDFIDGRDPSSWESKLKPDTKAIYVETISNPLMGVPELSEVVDFARSHELISMVDNTFASPVNFRPAEWGFDLSFHSGTKYLGGHSDIVAGAVIGRKDLVRDVFVNLKYYGGSLDPHACFLLHRGLKTLGVRVRQQNQNALAVAQFLEKHAAIADVKYPGLPSSPDHERATRFLDGFGGMLSFDPAGGAEAARRIMDRVEIPIVAPSLGGVESLFSMPATTSHLAVPPDERAAMGIGDGMIRMSVGIESADDLIEDLRQAIG
ncbi:MAG: PLP-dependent aspartate aminotransferase family protein [Candidatus Latescibacterota bacterium]|jgi:cystathionine beta-lyase/cystathionine gamma-synthase